MGETEGPDLIDLHGHHSNVGADVNRDGKPVVYLRSGKDEDIVE